ncbi:hypothetical protein Q4579_11165 [Photobacterium sp. 1_MG-2023]|nr:hypothetical protein [Photobacterium sp. 1_MG-2023]
MRTNKSGFVLPKVILLITSVSLAGCGLLKAQCIAIQPVLVNTTYNETYRVFTVPQNEMAEITTYIEQLRQCSEP